MATGKVVKLVQSFGSTWGRLKPNGETREVFFGSAALAESSEFARLTVGQEVEFDEEPDRANGTQAVHVRIPVF